MTTKNNTKLELINPKNNIRNLQLHKPQKIIEKTIKIFLYNFTSLKSFKLKNENTAKIGIKINKKLLEKNSINK